MGIAEKHAYRFGYLKSEDWQNVRYEILARAKARCFICGKESIHNDVHHRFYPRKIWQTRAAHCVVLCREHHDLVHARGVTRWRDLRRLKKEVLTIRPSCTSGVVCDKKFRAAQPGVRTVT